ncbi:hypothetical protein [Paenibacillus aceti]|uniref:Transposase n=1 Tax=Paenibacillus aceti TaxID=1820010 RepID=A0ABQ1VYB2_9BACL|nr:hypothetical protein [Paenibacillus aceti]GGG04129.1 hypothetical protein GCM10010913_27400 [Paenibacillus aceti]
MSKEKKDMLPVSREQVEVEGVYTDELGREEYLHKGEEFPADLVHGTVEWKLTELAQIKHAEGQTSPEFDPEED